MPQPELPSALVQEADCSERVVVLKIRVPGRTAFVILAAARSGGAAGLLAQGVRQELWGGRLPPGSTRQRGKELSLARGRIVAMGAAEIFVETREARGVGAEVGVEVEVEVEVDVGVGAGVAVGAGGAASSAINDAEETSERLAVAMQCWRAHGGRIVVTTSTVPHGVKPFVVAMEENRAALEARGLAIATEIAGDAIEHHRAELVRALEKSRQRIERRRVAIGADLAKIADADKIAAQAQWLVAEAARAPRGATSLTVTDWSSGEAATMEVPLDPAKSAREQVAAMFKRAKRLKLGGRIAEERLSQADAQASAVAGAIAAVRGAPSLADMTAAAQEAKRAAPRDVALPGAAPQGGDGGRHSGASHDKTSTPKQGRRVAFRTFVARSGKKLLVGKGGADNDTLTMKTARPHDLWLHAKNRTGAHVIVQLDKGQTCPGEDLVDAAHLAAHFSDARDEKAVDVQYTPRRYLHKPKGSAAGLVIVDREKVLPLRFDPSLLRQLLEREEM